MTISQPRCKSQTSDLDCNDWFDGTTVSHTQVVLQVSLTATRAFNTIIVRRTLLEGPPTRSFQEIHFSLFHGGTRPHYLYSRDQDKLSLSFRKDLVPSRL